MQLSRHFNFHNGSPEGEPTLRDSEHSTPSMANQEDERIDNQSSPPQERNLLNSINEIRFFEQYKKIYNVAYHLGQEKNRLFTQFNKLMERLQLLEVNFLVNKQKIRNYEDQETKKIDSSESQNRIKRSRRTAQMIQKKFKCNANFCDRQYGSQGSLQQHIKLKHPDIYQSLGDENIVQNGSYKNQV